ncbi:hypothetical protein PGIGA_G00000180 [Pangasianodon gigas]|uniref:Uncharacterized protein n=1 Tax=Pangasianodon gigas TaxID=30993 RepID=A0ACC5W516_PANGG|nr:hypothetical protein [Pangasianodon gigas]
MVPDLRSNTRVSERFGGGGQCRSESGFMSPPAEIKKLGSESHPVISANTVRRRVLTTAPRLQSERSSSPAWSRQRIRAARVPPAAAVQAPGETLGLRRSLRCLCTNDRLYRLCRLYSDSLTQLSISSS